MVVFPNAKINLGLYVTSKREDGYHELVTVMIPVGWHDVLEIIPSSNNATTLSVSGRRVDCPPEKNLVMKAYRMLSDQLGGLPPVEMYLEKQIPDGAGLGGGSADAAFAIKALDSIFNLGLPSETLMSVAARIGADCSFFINNRPALCTGIGEIVDNDININLSQYAILIVKPLGVSVSTRMAYDGISVAPCEYNLKDILSKEVAEWSDKLTNDFEKNIFRAFPTISAIKEKMIQSGALYASMTGSGAAVYGIYQNDKLALEAYDKFSDCEKIVTHIV